MLLHMWGTKRKKKPLTCLMLYHIYHSHVYTMFTIGVFTPCNTQYVYTIITKPTILNHNNIHKFTLCNIYKCTPFNTAHTFTPSSTVQMFTPCNTIVYEFTPCNTTQIYTPSLSTYLHIVTLLYTM